MPVYAPKPLDFLAIHVMANPEPINTHPVIYKALYALTAERPPTDWDIMQTECMFRKLRPWFEREVLRYDLHPMIRDLLTSDTHRPLLQYVTNWHEMVLEWPHKAQGNSNRIAFTLDDAKGEADRQTVTTFGKYLRRHMPDCPDHILRDFTTRYTVDATKCHITTNMDKIIDVVRKGPASCMSKFDAHDHPYKVYDPSLGWALAYRTQGDGEYWGRAIINQNSMMFVRSFKRCPNDGYSHSDELLEAWLESQGYTHESSWEDHRLAKVGDLMPYIDGDDQEVDDCGTHWHICANGEYRCTSVEGYVEENGIECDHCGSRVDEYEITYIDDGSVYVCDSCREDDYTLAMSRYGQEWLRNEEVVYCESNGCYYDENYLAYHDIVLPEDSCDYYHIDDTWTCDGSGNIYYGTMHRYTIEGETYHEDYLPDGWEVVDGEAVQVECED